MTEKEYKEYIYEKANKVKTEKQLNELLKEVIESKDLDYGKIVYAMSACMIATANYINGSDVGGIEFRDKDNTTHTTNTLNKEYDLGTSRIIRSNKAYLSNDIKSIVYKDKEYDIKILKAFEIIKEKRINIDLLLICHETKQPVKNYNKTLLACNSGKLTREEYDLLREILL